MDYTVIRDNVYLGARLCSVAKAGEIILAESVRALLDKDNYALEKLEPINVKGKKNKIIIYRAGY